MKKTFFSLILALSVYCSYAQNTFPGTGNVGIGTTSPQSILDIGKNQSAPAFKIGNSGYGTSYNSVWGLQSGAQSIMIFGNNGSNEIRAGNTNPGGYLDFYTNNTTDYTSASNGNFTMRLASNGNVGIGTTSPTGSLQVDDASVDDNNIIISNQKNGYASGAKNMLAFTQGTGAATLNGRIGFDYNSTTMQIINGSTIGLSVNPSGFVGIGTTGPVAKMDISDGNGTGLIAYIGASNITGAKGIYFDRNGSTSNPINIQGTQAGIGAANISMQAGGGNVLIGQATQANSAYKLDVLGSARANKIVVNTDGADFVFDPEYKLPKLSEVKSYIDQNHHLPEIPPATTMQKDGMSVGEINTKLLQKVEELTLYAIDQQKQIELLKQQQDKSKQQEIRIAALEAALAKLTSSNK